MFSRSILLNPIKNIDELNKRLDFIGFVLQPGNRDFVESLQENIKRLSSDVNVWPFEYIPIRIIN